MLRKILRRIIDVLRYNYKPRLESMGLQLMKHRRSKVIIGRRPVALGGRR